MFPHCHTSASLQTAGWFVYTKLIKCHKKAQGRVLQTAAGTPIDAHVPNVPYSCPEKAPKPGIVPVYPHVFI